MKRFPHIRPPGFSAEQRTRLDDWLAQWHLDQKLRSQPPPEAVPVERIRAAVLEQNLDRLVTPFAGEPKPAVGQIRLLVPSLLPADCGPTYVAVLRPAVGGDYLVAPFSRFQTPAVPQEILLRSSPFALAVLCLWNARPVSAFVLCQSWYVSQLSPAEREDALVVCGLTGRSENIPIEIASRIGPPIYDPTDMRFSYMDAAEEMWRNITSFPSEAENGVIVRLPAFQAIAPEAALRLAADSAADFARVAILEVIPQRLFVHVFARPREKTLFLVGTNPLGESSLELDGTLVSVRGIGLAGQITSGHCLIRTDDPKEFALKDSSGQALCVTKVDGLPSMPQFSYVRLIEMVGLDPEAVSVLTDSELRRLLQHCPHETGIGATVIAELYFRDWLYVGSSRDELRDALADCGEAVIDCLLDDHLATVRTQQTWIEDAAAQVQMSGKTKAVWDCLATRIRAFIQADGIIPVVTGEMAEAVPIAFNLRTNESPETALRDIRGIPMPLWAEAQEIFGDLHVQHIGIQLQCSTRKTGRQFDGESFELPILLALARKRGLLPDYPPLSVLASGAVRGDIATAVAGLDAKTALARRMGVKVFVTPGVADSDVAMGTQAGMSIQDILPKLSVRLENAGLDRLDLRTATTRLNSLGDEIHMGTVSLSEAAARVARYEKILEQDPESRIAAESLIRAKVLRGTIANHSGDPQAGIKATQEAAELAAKLRIPLLHVNAVANRIVSLTDLGHLAEAESEGRHLLEWVLREFSGSSAEQLQAEMVASGALGGQPLLQTALQGVACAPESLRLLSRAFELARELQLPADICRDAIQLALWYALLDPAHSETESQKAQTVLEENPGVWLTPSLAYLRRVRLLGAYRAVQYYGVAVAGFADQALPEDDSVSLGWVQATSQKYRGVLLAKQGQIEAAEKDFASAWLILDRDPAALLRFIGGTIALAAGEAMWSENRSLAISYLHRARTVFSLHVDRFEGSVMGSLWLRRAEGLLAGTPPQHLPDPQRGFPY